MTMGIAILWFVVWLLFMFLNAATKDNDNRLRVLEKRLEQDTDVLREAASAAKKGVEIEET